MILKLILSLATTACFIIFVATVLNIVGFANPATQNLTIIANPVSKALKFDLGTDIFVLVASAGLSWVFIQWQKHI